jgi:tRNA nucleotidyltransferase (CCA-adding enzyme)
MRVGTGKIIDPHNGIEDIKKRVIKAVGNAKTRFKEDPLRMLRVARFSSQLEFTTEIKTIEAIREKNYKILEVSKERWVNELDKILVSDCPQIGLETLAHTGLLNYIIPELSLQVGYDQNSKYHSLPLWEHTLQVINNVNADIILRWSALLHDVGKPFVRKKNKKSGYYNYIKHDLLGAEIVEKIGRHLKFSNDRREQIKNIVLHHLDEDSPLKEADDLAKG